MRNYKASSQAHVQAIRQWGLEGEGYTLIVYNNSSTGRIERKLSFSSDAKGRRIIVSKKGKETMNLIFKEGKLDMRFLPKEDKLKNAKALLLNSVEECTIGERKLSKENSDLDTMLTEIAKILVG